VVIFWTMRRHGGPVTFVERQIAHVWAGSIIPTSLIFLIEMWLDLPVLRLSPVIALVSGSVFFVKAGILSGEFYLQAGALYATALAMALGDRQAFPYGISLFGFVAAICFFVPGLKHYRAKFKGRT
jgi:serine/threonine-protein kinase